MKHDVLKIYWERMGKPALEFKYADDPWLPVQGNPSFNPAFEYRFTGPPKGRTDTEQESVDYKQGYQQALEDMKAEVERMATTKRCLSKNNT